MLNTPTTRAANERDEFVRTVAELARQMSAETSPTNALSHLVRVLRQALEIDRAGVFLYNQHRGTIDRLVGIDPHGKPEFEGESIAVRDVLHPMMLVANGSMPFYFTNDAPADFPNVEFTPGVRALGVIPIMASNCLLGVLCVDNVLTGRPFDETLVDLLYLFATLAAAPLFAIYQRTERERVDAIRRRIYRDVFMAATSGKIQLCTPQEIDAEWPDFGESVAIEREEDVGLVREKVRLCAEKAGLDPERAWDLVLCASEAVTNALLHGNGGRAAVEARDGTVRLRVSDNGQGISLEDLPDATLRPGWSKGKMPSMGHGFVLMYKLADCLYLNTSENGTTLILQMNEQAADPLLPDWDGLLCCPATPWDSTSVRNRLALSWWTSRTVTRSPPPFAPTPAG